MGKRLHLLMGILLLSLCGTAQQGNNPFELPGRPVESKQKQPEASTPDNPFELENTTASPIDNRLAPATKSDNPFELNARPSSLKNKNENENENSVVEGPKDSAGIPLAIPPLSARFKLWMSIIFISILTVLVNVYKSTLVKIYRSFLNDNFLKMIHRDQGTVLAIPYFIFYVFALINIGIFVFVVLRHFGIRFFASDFGSMAACVGGVVVLFFCKHLLLLILGYILPVKKEFHQYNFTIIIFGIILGLLLIPAVFLVSYAPSTLTRPVIYGTFGVVGMVYLYRILRSLFIGLRFISLHKFHFFVYLCTVEIAPVLVLLKLITGPWF